jgi:hypothetical protein
MKKIVMFLSSKKFIIPAVITAVLTAAVVGLSTLKVNHILEDESIDELDAA